MATRSPEAIIARISEVERDDWMGTQRSDLINYLPYEQARRWLKDGVTEQEWADATAEQDPAKQARDYLPFAVEKAIGHRGLSAGRSIDHLRAWLWLLGDEPYRRLEAAEYAQYGVPQLRIAHDVLGVPWPGGEVLDRMAQGLPCEDDCMDGCST